MRITAWKALARGVVLESLRRKDLWVVAILGFLIVISAITLGIFGVNGLQIFIKDLAAGVLGLFGVLIAAMVSTRQLPEEIKNRTLYPLLARPITRMDLLVGKLLGSVAATWIGFMMLAALTCVAMIIFRIHFEPIMLQYLLLKLCGLLMICAVGVAFSTFMTQGAAITMTLIFGLASTAISRALFLAGAGSPAFAWFFKLVSAALPQVHLFDIGARAVYIGWSPVPMAVVLELLVYMAVYSFAMLSLGWLKFRNQPI